MKYFLSIFASFILLSCAKKEATHQDEIKLFQYDLNIEFADATKSPFNRRRYKNI